MYIVQYTRCVAYSTMFWHSDSSSKLKFIAKQSLRLIFAIFSFFIPNYTNNEHAANIISILHADPVIDTVGRRIYSTSYNSAVIWRDRYSIEFVEWNANQIRSILQKRQVVQGNYDLISTHFTNLCIWTC